MARGMRGGANPAAPAGPLPIGKPKLLIGEGLEEVFFFRALLRYLRIDDVAVKDYGGKTNLRPYLRTLALAHDFMSLRALGVTRDADSDAAGALKSVNDAVAAAGLSVSPAAVLSQPATRIFILPGSGQSGMLEDLCWSAIADDPASSCVEDFIGCVQRTGGDPQPLAKARVHAWLASRERPDLRVGEAAERGYWPFDHPAFGPLLTFIRGL